jgi:hypothetical protein
VPPPPSSKPSADDRFDEFYDAYPRRQDRRAAEKAWRAAIKRGANPDHVIDRARAYARLQIGNERRFIKLPATWLNAGSYDDEITQPHLRAVPHPMRPAEAFDDLRARAAAQEAALLIRVAWIEAPQPPSDKTDPREWSRRHRLRFIDDHADDIRAALARRHEAAG